MSELKKILQKFATNPEVAIEQLKSCNYECEGGALENNVAFMVLENLQHENEVLKNEITALHAAASANHALYQNTTQELEQAKKQARDARNELCLKCSKYKIEHLGGCNGCRWQKKGE